MPVASGVVNKIRQRDDQLVAVTLRVLDVEEPFAARAARLVDHDDRLLGQVVLGDNALRHAGHLIGAAAGAGRDNDFDGMGRLPRLAQGTTSQHAPPTQMRSDALRPCW